MLTRLNSRSPFAALALLVLSFGFWGCEEDKCDGQEPAKLTCVSDIECAMECDCADGQTVRYGLCELVCGEDGECASVGRCISAKDSCNTACEHYHTKWKGAACFVGQKSNKRDDSQQATGDASVSDQDAENTEQTGDSSTEDKDSAIHIEAH